MDPEKVTCANPDCGNMILPATAQRTGGKCMRCVGREADAERQEHIRKHHREVDPYAGLSDLVEIIHAVHTPRSRQGGLFTFLPPPKPVEELYAALTVPEAARLVDITIEAKREGKRFAEDIAQHLATLTDHTLERLQAVWADDGTLHPSVLFRGAGPAVRDAIIQHLARPGLANDALNALAWIGDNLVQQRFSDWQAHPPPWRAKLYVGPEIYAHQAGWELTLAGRRDLFHPTCHAIKRAETPAARDPAIATFSAASARCPWCERPLVHMLELDLSDARFSFLGFNAPYLRVLTCEVCTCFAESIFARIEQDGSAHWHERNAKPSYLGNGGEWATSGWVGLALALSPRLPGPIDPGSLINASQIGGLPAWQQDAHYPPCPDCGVRMTFIAQLDNSAVEHGVGTHYLHLCARCRVTATSYQQT